MSNGDLFYVCGAALAVSAVVFSFIGLRVKGFPGRFGAVVVLFFVALIGATASFSVLHAKDEERHEEPALNEATEEAEEVEQQ